MKILPQFAINNFQYNSPINVNKHTISKNQILSVEFYFQETYLKAELISLPHFHRYSLIEWKYYLQAFFAEKELSFDCIKMDSPYFNMTSSNETNLELIYIVEVVLFELLKVKNIVSTPSQKVESAVLNPNFSDFKNCQCLKIKLPKNFDKKTIAEYGKNLQKIFQINRSIKIRFDGNQKLTPTELITFLDALINSFGDLNFIDFFEEPTNNFSSNFKILSDYKVKYGIDETIEPFIHNLNVLKNANIVLILKPSKLSISKTTQIINNYASFFRIIISSSFESKNTHSITEFLSQMLPLEIHGIDTLYPLPNFPK